MWVDNLVLFLVKTNSRNLTNHMNIDQTINALSNETFMISISSIQMF